MLGIFPEDAQVPLDVVGMLYVAAGGLEDAAEAGDCVQRMAELQLVELHAERRTVSMIDLHLDYMRCRGKSDAARWHAALLHGWMESCGSERQHGLAMNPV